MTVMREELDTALLKSGKDAKTIKPASCTGRVMVKNVFGVEN